MTKIRPFKAIRPNRDIANLFATRSYLTYSNETLKEKLDNNPYTFLHIINPDFYNNIKQKGVNKFKKVKEKYNRFIEKSYLKQDDIPAFYIYEQQSKENTFEGIIGAVSIKEYLSGNIKKHEHTIPEREMLFSNYLSITEFNADPVLICHREERVLNELILKYKKTRSEYEFRTTDKKSHKLWIINNISDIKFIQATYNKIPNMYIADGHHRCASSALLSKNKKTKNSNYFMSLLINENLLNIKSFYRVINGLNNLSANAFISKLRERFKLRICKVYTPKNNEIGMYINQKYYALNLKENYKKENCLDKLDPAILYNNILKPILNIKDERTDKRISFINGGIPINEIEKLVNENIYNVAFILKPIPFDSIKDVADKNLFMPPKSTYIEPKLRSGLTIYSIN